jgi:hypothetical protein
MALASEGGVESVVKKVTLKDHTEWLKASVSSACALVATVGYARRAYSRPDLSLTPVADSTNFLAPLTTGHRSTWVMASRLAPHR